MLASSSIAILLSAAAVMASTHQARSHNAIAMRMNNSTVSLDKRDTYMGKEMTWYPTDTGPDACTGKNHLDSDWYVAMGYDQFGDGSGCCGRQLRINYNGKSTVATCVDECASCPQWGQIEWQKAKDLVEEALDACPLPTIRRFFRRANQYASVYQLGATGPVAEFAVKQYRSYRGFLKTELEAARVQCSAV
ncbi:hypothetical protein B0H10DRAFT_2225150 [Mycena sp. CBHHK59/15]|nr:hypothetical protein B0H10DRAFT_2225150 [Mycena sp. CBHHK59/15]